jgi:cysteine synthase
MSLERRVLLRALGAELVLTGRERRVLGQPPSHEETTAVMRVVKA